jgi:hypothetical protein
MACPQPEKMPHPSFHSWTRNSICALLGLYALAAAGGCSSGRGMIIRPANPDASPGDGQVEASPTVDQSQPPDRPAGGARDFHPARRRCQRLPPGAGGARDFHPAQEVPETSTRHSRPAGGARDFHPAATSAELRAFCLKSLGVFQVPEKFIFLKELPKTATGKIHKRELSKVGEVERRRCAQEVPETSTRQEVRAEGARDFRHGDLGASRYARSGHTLAQCVRRGPNRRQARRAGGREGRLSGDEVSGTFCARNYSTLRSLAPPLGHHPLGQAMRMPAGRAGDYLPGE